MQSKRSIFNLFRLHKGNRASIGASALCGTMDRKASIGSIDIVIDAASVYTCMGKRDDHLRSIDFLNAMEFPAITYQAKTVEFHKGGKMAPRVI